MDISIEDPFWEVNFQAVPIYVEEAKRVGKCPWIPCYFTEQFVYNLMNYLEDKEYPLETFEETQERRNKEK
jgi:hypothetical protein